MKILLVNPPSFLDQHQSIIVPPLGLLLIGTVLKKAGHETTIVDASAEKMDWQKLFDLIKKKSPDILGMTGLTPSIESCFRTVRIARPFVKHVIIGGPHPTIYKQSVFKQCPEIDFCVVGEGEETVLELVNALEENKDISGIYGTISKTIKNPHRDTISDISKIPIPDRSLIKNDLYRYPFFKKSPVTTMITSRGCPYKCAFCDKSVFGDNWRSRSPENVLEELDSIIRQFKIKSLIFYDDLFTANKDRVVEICEGIIKRNYSFEWKCEGRVNLADEEVYTLMKKAGCSMIAYGVENGNQAALDYLCKGISIDQIEKAFRLTRKVGIRTMAYFILGVPVNSYADEIKTIEFAKRLDPDYAQFGILTPFLGTKLYEDTIKNGWYSVIQTNNPVDKYESRPVTMSDKWDEGKLKKILNTAHKAFYLRPNYIYRQVLSMRSPYQFMSNLKELINLTNWIKNEK